MTERAAFERLLGELRPKLHRYCARMTGSVIDGEDVVQEAVLKAIEALDEAGALANPEGWLFRIAHNAALDFLRRQARQQAVRSDEDPDMTADHATPGDQGLAASRPWAPARTRAGERRRAAADAGGGRARAFRRLRRSFQRPRLRRGARHAGRRSETRSRQQAAAQWPH